MKNKLLGCIASILILLLLCSGVFADLLNFFCWLFLLQYTAPETSVVGGILVRILTFLVSYGLVGVIFNMFGLFNGKVMSLFYTIISTLLGFAIAYIVWVIEQYIIVVGIIMGLIVLLLLVYFIFNCYYKKKKEHKQSGGPNEQ